MANCENCQGIEIEDADITCIGFLNDSCPGCEGLPSGSSRVGINAAGNLVVYANVGGNCTETEIGGGGIVFDCSNLNACDIEDLGNVSAGALAGQVLVYDGIGTWTPLDVATGTDSLVDNADGTYTHTAIGGLIQIINICDSLQYCDLEDLGNVTPGATIGQVLAFDGADWTPLDIAGSDSLVDNGDGTYTHTAADGAIVIINVCGSLVHCTIEQLGNVVGGALAGEALVFNGVNWVPTAVAIGTDSLVNNGDGTFTHTAVDGTIIIIDICTVITNCDIENLGNVSAGAVNGNILVFNGANWTPQAQTINTDSLVDNGDGTYTHTAVDGVIVIIDVCGSLVNCTLDQLGDVAAGATAGQVLVFNGADWIPTTPPLDVDTLVNNGDGTFTHTAVDGTAIIIDVCTLIGDGGCTDTLVDNGDGTYSHTSLAGIPVTITICDDLDFCTIEDLGNVAAGATLGQVLVFNGANWIPTDPLNLVIGPDTLVDNGDGSFTHTSIDGTPVTINVCQLMLDAGCVDSVVNNVNGTYTHTNTQGIQQIIDICGSLVYCQLEQLGDVAAGATPDQVLVFNGADWIPSDLGTDSLVDNGDGTYTHTAADGAIVVIDICDSLQYCTIGNIGNVDISADAPVMTQVLTWDGAAWSPDDRTTTVTAQGATPVINFDQLDANPATDFPVVRTLYDTTCIQITNPSLTRSMAVHAIWDGVNADAFLNSVTPPWSFRTAVQPVYLVDGIAINGGGAGTDASFFFSGETSGGHSGSKQTNGLTVTYIIAPGAMTEICQETYVDVSSLTNLDVNAALTIGAGRMSLFGSLI